MIFHSIHCSQNNWTKIGAMGYQRWSANGKPWKCSHWTFYVMVGMAGLQCGIYIWHFSKVCIVVKLPNNVTKPDHLISLYFFDILFPIKKMDFGRQSCCYYHGSIIFWLCVCCIPYLVWNRWKSWCVNGYKWHIGGISWHYSILCSGDNCTCW